MTKICFWFYTGVKLYSLLEAGFFGFYLQKRLEIIQRLSFVELFLTFFTGYLLVCVLVDFVFIPLLIDSFNLDYLSTCFTDSKDIEKEESESKEDHRLQGPYRIPVNFNNSLGKASDGAIMTAALAAGMKGFQKAPIPMSKIASAIASIGVGSAAIIAKML